MFNICETLRFSYDTIVDKFNYADKYNSIYNAAKSNNASARHKQQHAFLHFS